VVQQWEYLVVRFDHGGWDANAGAGSRRGRIGLDVQADILNRFGSDGWELAGTASGSSAEFRLFFKRPKP
jgi:hypothetical protein